MLLPITIATALIASTFAAPTARSFSNHVVVEKRASAPRAWKRADTALDSQYVIPLRIGLTQSNLHLLDGDDPASEKYGQHWSASEVAAFFAPKESTVSAVKTWLTDAGFAPHRLQLTGGNQWLTVNVTINEAEELLNARYEMFEHRSGVMRPATHSYSVPAHIVEHVDIITPTMHFDLYERSSDSQLDDGQLSRRAMIADPKAAAAPASGPVSTGSTAQKIPSPGSSKSGNGPKLSPLGFAGAYAAVEAAGDLSNCVNVTNIDCLKALYNFAGYEQKSIASNTYGIVEYTPNMYAPQDLDMFFKQFVPEAVGVRPKTFALDGGVVVPYPSNFEVNGESDLDLEYAMGIMYPMIPTLYQVGADGSFNNFLDGLDASYCTYEGGDDATVDAPYSNYPGACGSLPYSAIISTSYGSNEADASAAYEQRQCNEYAKLGAQGYTILYSSGDTGVAGNFGECIDPTTGQETPSEEGVVGTTFNPSFPGTCPYITSVGATQTKAGADLVNHPDTAEEACESVIYSGGGFSNVFKMPSYQKAAVAAYYKSYAPYYGSAVYNNSRAVRGYPDIAVNGANYIVSYSGSNGLVYGTSCSSPVAGALFALINDARFAAGKSAIGFINPAIYSTAFKRGKGFNDITEGGNQGCGTPGFTAVPGWDPVTGLGTPNFGNLLPLFMALP